MEPNSGQGSRPGQRFRFEDTKGACFICLNPVVEFLVSEPGLSSRSDLTIDGNRKAAAVVAQRTSLLYNICRYLELDLEFVELLISQQGGPLQLEDLKVTICGECGEIVGRLSELFESQEYRRQMIQEKGAETGGDLLQELEATEAEIRSGVGDLGQLLKMEVDKNAPPKVKQLQKLMNVQHRLADFYLDVMKGLRMEIARKCFERASKYEPGIADLEGPANVRIGNPDVEPMGEKASAPAWNDFDQPYHEQYDDIDIDAMSPTTTPSSASSSPPCASQPSDSNSTSIDDPAPATCYFCQEPFPTEEAVEQHFLTVHLSSIRSWARKLHPNKAPTSVSNSGSQISGINGDEHEGSPPSNVSDTGFDFTPPSPPVPEQEHLKTAHAVVPRRQPPVAPSTSKKPAKKWRPAAKRLTTRSKNYLRKRKGPYLGSVARPNQDDLQDESQGGSGFSLEPAGSPPGGGVAKRTMPPLMQVDPQPSSSSSGSPAVEMEPPKKISNPGRDRYECGRCSKNYSTIGGYQRHFKVAHLSIRYECEVCDKRFTDPYNYKNHYRGKHLGLGFTCDICDQVYTLPSSLHMHRKSAHFGGQFKCRYCSRSFASKGAQFYHMRKRCPEKKGDVPAAVNNVSDASNAEDEN